ncbi:MAG TPA: hypothetical protein VFU23_11020 [Gemmatimonadales bacterium]|nr:hypothetical protein [Gemmatimonadales bacterium]
MDLGLAFYPFQLGTPEWEFGTASRVLDNLPLFSLGMALVLGHALAEGRRGLVRLIRIVLILLVVVVAVLSVFYLLNLPLAVKAVNQTAAIRELYKASVKTLVQGIAYAIAYLAMFFVAGRVTERNG